MAKRKKHRKNRNRRNKTGKSQPKRQDMCHLKEQADLVIAFLNKIIKRNPTNANLYIQRGSAYADKYEYDKAIVD
jgi:hypothetical protein